MILINATGLLAVIVWHAYCPTFGEIEHFDHEYDREHYDALPHLYMVLVKNGGGPSGIPVGTFVVKTRDHHDHATFPELMMQCAQGCFGKELTDRWNVIARPQKITLEGEPLSGVEMLRMTVNLMLAHSPASTV
jgi:hypothetical protein